MTWTTADLIRRVRRKLRIPDGAVAVSDAEILEIADEVSRIHVQKLLKSVPGEWGVMYSDTAIIAGQETYRIPSAAQGGALRDVTLVDSEGDEYDLPELKLEEARIRSRPLRPGTYRGQLLEGNNLVLRPVPTEVSCSIRFRFRRRPSKLVPTAEAAQVSYIDASTFWTAAVPTAWAASLFIDVVQGDPPFDLLVQTAAVSRSSNVFTPVAGMSSLSELTEGDWVALPGETPVPQVPDLCHDLLVYGTAHVAAGELGKREREQALERSFRDCLSSVREQLGDRNEGSERKIMSPHSPLRGGRF